MNPSPSLSMPSEQAHASSCRSVFPSWSLSTPSQHEPLVQLAAQLSAGLQFDESQPSAETLVHTGTEARSAHWRANSAENADARPAFCT